jgi:hypothetical protein
MLDDNAHFLWKLSESAATPGQKVDGDQRQPSQIPANTTPWRNRPSSQVKQFTTSVTKSRFDGVASCHAAPTTHF